MPSSSPLLPALSDAVRRFHIPPEHLLAVLDGVEMDLDGRRYETFDELAEYCHCVASAVGLACIHIWGFRGPEAFEPARQCGLAFQLTNILRDLREDAGRRAHLSAAGATFGTAATRRTTCCAALPTSASTVSWPSRSIGPRRFYHQGAALFDFLEPDGRRIFGMMTATYHALLRRIARRPARS